MAPAFKQRLNSQVCPTVDLDEGCEQPLAVQQVPRPAPGIADAESTAAPLAKPQDARESALQLLKRAASEALAAPGLPKKGEEEATAIAKAIEGALFGVALAGGQKRRYLAEVRRLGAALREGCLSDSLQERGYRGLQTWPKVACKQHERLCCCRLRTCSQPPSERGCRN
ncbi:Cnot8 [Symbiodinium natans]|uniref:Cnot8 protein n=1 Tax=Symbiodinium natans TaxID=878477 RepID=A0A812SNG4_9DINO|nr:Cnot8 [Symbiodinium natans]